MFRQALPIIAVSIIMAYLYKASKGKPKIDTKGNFILKLPKLYAILGFIGIAIAITLFIYDIFVTNEEDKTIIFSLGFFSVLLGLPLFLVGSISHIKLTEFAIIQTTMFGKTKEIKWEEINDVKFGKVSSELKIKSADRSIKANLHLIGFDSLVNKLVEKTGKSLQEMGFPV
jgi:hypothetical protein